MCFKLMCHYSIIENSVGESERSKIMNHGVGGLFKDSVYNNNNKNK